MPSTIFAVSHEIVEAGQRVGPTQKLAAMVDAFRRQLAHVASPLAFRRFITRLAGWLATLRQFASLGLPGWPSKGSFSFALAYTVGFLLGFLGLAHVWHNARFLSCLFFHTKVLLSRRVFSIFPNMRSEVLRDVFVNTVFPSVAISENHTHGVAAAGRNAAVIYMERLAANLGLVDYHFQMSRADERNGRVGSRQYFWAKDLTAREGPLDIPKNALLCMTDVDQYVDMPVFLLDNFMPTLIYTVQPNSVCKNGVDYKYTFLEGNLLEYHVTGGAHYVGLVWNYQVDNFVIRLEILGRPFCTVAYAVERHTVSPDHEMVFLIPIRKWYASTPSMFWNSPKIEAPTLKHYMPNTPTGYNRLRIHSVKDGFQMSTGLIGSYASAITSVENDDLIASIATNSKSDIVQPQIEAWTNDKKSAVVLLGYHRKKTPHKAMVVCPVNEAVRSYQFRPSRYDPEAKQGMVPFMQPLLHGAFVPARTKANEETCLEERLDKVKVPKLEMTTFLWRVIREYVDEAIPQIDIHSYDPVDYEIVIERQHRATQRRMLAAVESIVDPIHRVVKMFMKREPYLNIKPPRPISQINTVDKREWSRFLYGFERVMKYQRWYAFGKTPAEIATRVTKVLQFAEKATNTDFSKFDGHNSNILREVERMVMLRAFRPMYHARIIVLHKANYCLRGYGEFGSKYDTDFSRLSGSAETSAFNSIANSFISFLALRMTMRNGYFLNASEAFDRLGIYGGDDGLTADVEPETFIKAAKMVGQELTVELVKYGELGVKFLARVYSPYVWCGDKTSCCDVPRQLAKLHVSANLPADVTPSEKFAEKMRGFSLSDRNTPILRELVAAAYRLHDGPIQASERTKLIRTWNSQFDMEDQYPNERHDWMDGWLHTVLPDFRIDMFLEWIASRRRFDDLLSPPMFMEPVAAISDIPMVIDGESLPRSLKITHDQPRPEAHGLVKRVELDSDTNPELVRIDTKIPAQAKTGWVLKRKADPGLQSLVTELAKLEIKQQDEEFPENMDLDFKQRRDLILDHKHSFSNSLLTLASPGELLDDLKSSGRVSPSIATVNPPPEHHHYWGLRRSIDDMTLHRYCWVPLGQPNDACAHPDEHTKMAPCTPPTRNTRGEMIIEANYNDPLVLAQRLRYQRAVRSNGVPPPAGNGNGYKRPRRLSPNRPESGLTIRNLKTDKKLPGKTPSVTSARSQRATAWRARGRGAARGIGQARGSSTKGYRGRGA